MVAVLLSAVNIKEELTKSMGSFGFVIIQALVNDIDPAARVKVQRGPAALVVSRAAGCIDSLRLQLPDARSPLIRLPNLAGGHERDQCRSEAPASCRGES